MSNLDKLKITIRKAHREGITQKSLCDKAGYTPSYLTNIKKGRYPCSRIILRRIKIAYEDLSRREPEPEQELTDNPSDVVEGVSDVAESVDDDRTNKPEPEEKDEWFGVW